MRVQRNADRLPNQDETHTQRARDEEGPPSHAVDGIPRQEGGGDIPDLGPATEVEGAFGGHAEGGLVERRRVVGYDVDAGQLLHELDAEGQIEALVGGHAIGAEEIGPGPGVCAFQIDCGVYGVRFGANGG